MPVTRDMTAGARTLLYNFLDGVQPAAADAMLAAAPPAAPAPVEEEAPAPAPAPAPTGLAAMSRSMR